MKNKIDDLRNHLFETLEALKDKEDPMDLDRARAVADVARAVIESAKVEVDFLKVTGGVKSTNFLPTEDDASETGQAALPPARPRAIGVRG